MGTFSPEHAFALRWDLHEMYCTITVGCTREWDVQQCSLITLHIPGPVLVDQTQKRIPHSPPRDHQEEEPLLCRFSPYKRRSFPSNPFWFPWVPDQREWQAS